MVKQKLVKQKLIDLLKKDKTDLYNSLSYIIPLGEECYTSQSIDKKFNFNKDLISLVLFY